VHSRSPGGWSKERALYLRFRDGAILTTMNGLAEATLAQRETLADFVSGRSGVPVEHPPLEAFVAAQRVLHIDRSTELTW
jgi:hypothetical protein